MSRSARTIRTFGAWLVIGAMAAQPATGIEIVVSGGTWNAGTFGPADISAGAGTDFTNPTTSSVNQVVIEVSDTTLSWNLSVRKSSGAWPASMSLAIRRNGDLDWHEITTSDTVFFSGSGNTSNIECQLRVVKAVTFGASLFTTTVTYTVDEQ
jgi:hypothetical protein